MAELFLKQAKHYAVSRPDYPNALFRFIASKTPFHDLAWDVGTGTGQAAISLAEIYKNVIATDTSSKQLELAPKLPNIRYKHTPQATMSMSETEALLGPKSSLDLVTIAQAIHWFDLPSFYDQVKWALRKPNGVVAAWCYTLPRLGPAFDPVLDRFYWVYSKPYWDPARRLVEEELRGIEFPFESVDVVDGTGPFEFESEKGMDFEGFLEYIRSWSAYQTAKEKGFELLGKNVVDEFKKGWESEGESAKKVLKFPIFLRIGKVGDQ